LYLSLFPLAFQQLRDIPFPCRIFSEHVVKPCLSASRGAALCSSVNHI
jgi:hypothetical protein